MSDLAGTRSAGEAGAGPEAVRREVWRSLVSLLRSYTNAAALNGGEFSVTEPELGTARLQHQDVELNLRLNFSNGAAGWRLTRKGREENQGEFQISDDGSFYSAGEEKQLDEAAIEWVEALAGEKAAH